MDIQKSLHNQCSYSSIKWGHGHEKDCSKKKQVHSGFTLVSQAELNLSIDPSILGICDGNALQGHVFQP
jgi:hypothetical protein